MPVSWTEEKSSYSNYYCSADDRVACKKIEGALNFEWLASHSDAALSMNAALPYVNRIQNINSDFEESYIY